MTDTRSKRGADAPVLAPMDGLFGDILTTLREVAAQQDHYLLLGQLDTAQRCFPRQPTTAWRLLIDCLGQLANVPLAPY